jgi:hypothetical protein
MFVNQPMTQTKQERCQSEQFISKLLNIMGLTNHPNRLHIARRMIAVCSQLSPWTLRYNTDDPKVQLALNLPYDMRISEKEFVNEDSSEMFVNEAMFFIWLNDICPQEGQGILCMCGVNDAICNETCEFYL